MTVMRLIELLRSAGTQATQEVIVCNADDEEYGIVAIRIPDDPSDAILLLTEAL